MINELKYNSPKDNYEENDKKSKETKNTVNIGGIIFPAYDEGKFYKNGEDVILKAKIDKIEE